MKHLQPGTMLSRYRILKVLGAGGFAVIYLAKDETLEKLFAIREYFPNEFADRHGESVAKEAFRASGLDYPRATVFTASPEVRMSHLATGRYISIIPDCILRFSTWRPELKALPVQQSLSSVPVGIVTLKNRTLSPVVQLFIDSAREVAKSLAKTK